MLLTLLFACSDPQCGDGEKFNTDGLCVTDTAIPVDSQPDDTSADDTSADDTSADDTSTDDTSADDTSTDDTSADDTAKDDTGVRTDWELLGGEPGVDVLLDSFLVNVAADAEINWMFANTDLVRLHDLLLEQISSATGGPYAYTGRDMLAAHDGMAITDDQWNALVGDLAGAMDSLAVPHSADFSGDLPADRLVRALAGMHDEIVEDPSGQLILFNQLGGHTGVSSVVNELLQEVGADARINTFFAGSDLAALNLLLVEQICDATGGYCVYSGRSMLDAHAGMGITDADFDALVEDLLNGLDDLNVDYTPATFDGGLPADALITALAGMRSEIVEN